MDKTRYISLLERYCAPVFLRPRCFVPTYEQFTEDGRLEPLVMNYFEEYLGQFPAQVFDKINENFIRCSFFELMSRYLSQCYTFVLEMNLLSGRADLVMTGVPGTIFHNDCRVLEFKYFKAKDAGRIAPHGNIL